MSWPYPGDSPLVRSRRVALAYRTALEQHCPEVCAALDTRMSQWGQTWIVPRVLTVDPDAWLNIHDAADLGGVSLDTLRAWRARGRLRGRRVGKTWEYRARDIMALGEKKRDRTKETPDAQP